MAIGDRVAHENRLQKFLTFSFTPVVCFAPFQVLPSRVVASRITRAIMHSSCAPNAWQSHFPHRPPLADCEITAPDRSGLFETALTSRPDIHLRMHAEYALDDISKKKRKGAIF